MLLFASFHPQLLVRLQSSSITKIHTVHTNPGHNPTGQNRTVLFAHSTSYYSEFTSVFVTDSQYHECICSVSHSITSVFVLQRDPGRA